MSAHLGTHSSLVSARRRTACRPIPTWRARTCLYLFVCSFASTAALLGSAEARTPPAHKHQSRHHQAGKAEHAKSEHGKRGADRKSSEARSPVRCIHEGF